MCVDVCVDAATLCGLLQELGDAAVSNLVEDEDRYQRAADDLRSELATAREQLKVRLPWSSAVYPRRHGNGHSTIHGQLITLYDCQQHLHTRMSVAPGGGGGGVPPPFPPSGDPFGKFHPRSTPCQFGIPLEESLCKSLICGIT